MQHMLAAAALPLLADITLAGIEDVEGCGNVYPFPIPDLFCGCPLLVTGAAHPRASGAMCAHAGARPGGAGRWGGRGVPLCERVMGRVT